MARIVVPEADAILDKEFPVLDKGFVRLVDYMGGDARVAASARVSYGAGTKTIREDKGLINYLVRNQHSSPLEQVSLVFHIKLPIFAFAQLARHRTAKLNSLSARYSVMKDEFYIPDANNVRAQSEINKQVGEGEVDADNALLFVQKLETICEENYAKYEESMNDLSVSREQARMMLPQNLYTEIYWKCDLHNLFHLLRLRLDAHAQMEIREYAKIMAKCAQAVAPMCYEAWETHILNACKLSSFEIEAVRNMLKGESPNLTDRQSKELNLKLGL